MRLSQLNKLVVNFVIALSLACAALISTAAQRPATRRVQFPAGSRTVTLTGTTGSASGEPTYMLRARRGQLLQAQLRSDSSANDVTFCIKRPGGRPLTTVDPADCQETNWSGRVPATGDYRIEVGKIEDGDARFTLRITLR